MSEDQSLLESAACPLCGANIHFSNFSAHMEKKHPGESVPMYVAFGGKLPLAAIETSSGTQARVEINTGRVKQYAEQMKEGDEFPALVVYLVEDGRYILVDGFHRLQAAKYIELATFDVIVQISTLRQAILDSKGVNKRHGLEMSTGDKRKIVTEMLQDPEWVNWSDGEIARHCGVSRPFVGGVRKELFPRTSNVTSAPARTYKTANGKTSTMKTGNIGKKTNATPTRQADEFSQQFPDDVPAVSVDEDDVIQESPVTQPPGTFKAIWMRGEVARTPPGATQPGHYDPLAGTRPSSGNGHAAPVSMRYQKHYMNGDYHIVDTQSGDVVDMDQVINLLNCRPAAPAVQTVEIEKPKPILAKVAADLDIKVDQLAPVANKWKEPATRAGLELIALIGKSKDDLNAFMDGLIQMITIEKPGRKAAKPKKPTIPKADMEAMENAIVGAFGLSIENITDTKWSEIRGAAKQLCMVKAIPYEMQGLHAYCYGRFEGRFSTMAMVKYYADWKKTPAAKNAGKVLVAVPEIPTPESDTVSTNDDQPIVRVDTDQLMREAFAKAAQNARLQPTGTEG